MTNAATKEAGKSYTFYCYSETRSVLDNIPERLKAKFINAAVIEFQKTVENDSELKKSLGLE